MKIQFWGAARVVTGSMHLLHLNGAKILLDCGLYQGRRKEAFKINHDLPFNAREIDALILSHAHVDHCGNIPNLVKNGFRGKIWCTPATQDLINYMLLDSAHIQESDVAYVNKQRRREGKKLFEPLYTSADALQALKQVEMVDYRQPFSPLAGVTAHFRDAGHMLGSANVTLDIAGQGPARRLAFSGDIGRKNLPILRDPQPVEGADVIIMEGTYGNRLHAPIEDAKADLQAVVKRTFDRGGVIIIPAFAVGRTQELVYALHQLRQANQIPKLEIYVDSPLAVNVTDAFARHPEVYDDEISAFMKTSDSGNPFGFDDLNYVRSVDESKMLNDLNQPAVIISASGMCEAGRVLHHLKHHISNDRNTILFVGYQGEDTLGRKILEGNSPVPILGELQEVQAEVHKLEGYSGHADRDGLLNWLRQSTAAKTPEYVFIVHCESEGGAPLADQIEAEGIARAIMPVRGQTFDLP